MIKEKIKTSTQNDSWVGECVLCGMEIPPEYDPSGKPFWYGGHNPQPLSNEGRCCDVCNHTKVIPARLRGM